MSKAAKQNSPTRILVFGTFDVLHKGHLDFFRQARALAKRPFLVVSLAKSRNVKKIKGQRPLHGERARLRAVRQSALVDRAVLGAASDYLKHIVWLRPEIIALGYDQSAYTADLGKKLKQRGLKIKIIRLKPYRPERYKSSIIKRLRGVDR